jgi:protein transport protein SEC24
MNPSPTSPTRKPEPLNYVFALDMTAESVESGFLASSCNALLSILFEDTAEGVQSCIASGSRIAIITFDGTLHFYNLSVSFLRLPLK